MDRRTFIGAAAGGLLTTPLAAHAQQPRMPVIGYLSGATLEMMDQYVAAFRGALADAGYIEGRNVTLEYRSAEGHNDRLPAQAAEFVRRRVDIIVVGGSTPGALAAKAASKTIPVIFLIGTDPVKLELVASLAKPGGNITGITILNVDLIAKCLELMHNLMPPSATIAVLVNPTNVAQATTERGIVLGTARALGARVVMLNASSPSEIDSAYATLVSERMGALVVSGENFFLTQRDRLVALAARNVVPAIYANREYTELGGLMSYGTSLVDAYRRIGIMTGRIFKGEKPADLPVEQNTKVELIINMKTAKSLGLTMPQSVLLRADEVDSIAVRHPNAA